MNTSKRLTFSNTRRLNDFKPLLNSFVDDWGYIYIHTILIWCRYIEEEEGDTLWEVWAIKHKGETIGICGLYSLEENYTEELWLGWFGIVPELRNKKLGGEALEFLEKKAKKHGCKTLYAYVDAHGKPLPFYYRNGFKRVSSVKKFLKDHPEIDRDTFENLNDHVIKKEI